MKRNFFSFHLLNNYHPSLHGLRFIAICGVIQNHVSFRLIYNQNAFAHLTSFQVFSQNLWFVMDLFFFMSGFLIGKILLTSFAENAGKSFKSWSHFYVQRGFRIFPLYYFFLLFYWLVIQYSPQFNEVFYIKENFLHWKEILFLTNYPFDPRRILAYWSWSLSAEEHFYLFCPLFIYVLLRLNSHALRIGLISLTWLSGAVVRYFIVTQSGPLQNPLFNTLVSLYTPTHSRYDIFFAGILLAYLQFYFNDHLKKLYDFKISRYLGWIIPLSIFTFISLPQWNPLPPELDFVGSIPQRLKQAQDGILYFGTLTGLAYLFLVSWCLYTQNFVTKFLGHTVFRHLATLGYGTYLVHIPVIIFITPMISKFFLIPSESFASAWILINTITLIISVVFSYILHLAIEKPALALRKLVTST